MELLLCFFYKDNVQHNKPHVHVRYQGYKASILIEDGNLIAGKVPKKQLKLIQAWIEIHREELIANWDLAVAGELPFRIAPLQ